MSNTNQITVSFKTLQIIHLALCTGVAVFLILTIVLNGGQGHIAVEPNDLPLLYVALTFAVFAPFLSKYLYQQKLGAIDLSAPLDKRFQQYLSACIVRYALIEAAAMLNIVVWFITHNLIAAIVATALIILLIALRPNKSRVSHILQVNYPETLD